MDGNPQIQALLQQGFLPFLAKKLGLQSPQVGPGGTTPFNPGGSPQGAPPPAPQGAAPSPGGTPPGAAPQPQQPQPQPSASGGSPSPYNIKSDPMSRVGNLQPPGAPTPRTQTPNFSGGPVAGLLQLLSNWHNTKQKSEQSEAARAAEALMQSIEGAKTTGDWTPTYTILHNNEKLFNKVYKGWLQKAEIQQKEKQKPEKVDPDVQGFEAGVQQYMSKKQGAPPPQGSAPRSVGGYQLPAASPQQQLGQQGVSAERQAQSQDPRRSLSGQLSSDEQRQVELTKTGMATTPETELKYRTEMTKSATELQVATANAQKAVAELQKAQTESSTAGEKGKLALQEQQAKVDKAKIDVDIARVKYQTAQLGGRLKGQASKVVSLSYQTKIAFAQAAMSMIQEVQKQNRGFSYNEIQKLQQELKTAGASGMTSDLPSKWTNWMHGVGQVNDFADRVGEYKTGLEKGLAEWQNQFGEASTKKEGDESDEGDDEGETMDFEYDAQGNRVKKPDEKPN